MDRRPFFLVGGLVAVVASAYAVQRLLADPDVRRRLGLGEGGPQPHYGDGVDQSSEDSFPASDPPSFTATTAGAGS